MKEPVIRQTAVALSFGPERLVAFVGSPWPCSFVVQAKEFSRGGISPDDCFELWNQSVIEHGAGLPGVRLLAADSGRASSFVVLAVVSFRLSRFMPVQCHDMAISKASSGMVGVVQRHDIAVWYWQ